jgi:hypothetical protein
MAISQSIFSRYNPPLNTETIASSDSLPPKISFNCLFFSMPHLQESFTEDTEWLEKYFVTVAPPPRTLQSRLIEGTLDQSFMPIIALLIIPFAVTMSVIFHTYQKWITWSPFGVFVTFNRKKFNILIKLETKSFSTTFFIEFCKIYEFFRNH